MEKRALLTDACVGVPQGDPYINLSALAAAPSTPHPAWDRIRSQFRTLSAQGAGAHLARKWLISLHCYIWGTSATVSDSWTTPRGIA
jgi:hypothetical protein